MIAFPGMLVAAAERAGMSVPEDPDAYEEEKEQHPHFFMFCVLQLARPMLDLGEHWDNAKIIAEIPAEELKTMTLEDFLAKGLSYASSR